MTEQPADVHLALDRLRALIGPEADPGQMHFFVHDGVPVSKSRARWTGKRMYTPKETVIAEDDLVWQFKGAIRGQMIEGMVAIMATFYRPNYQRIDTDNLMKLVMDAATRAGVWKDDCYVVAQAAFMEFDAKNPRTVVAWCPARTSFDRIRRAICATCGAEFVKAGEWSKSKTCSPECRHKSMQTMARCAKCDIEFPRKTKRQQYCSRVCSAQSPLRRQVQALQRPWPKCSACGLRVSRREYLLCWTCRFPSSSRKTKHNILPTEAT